MTATVVGNAAEAVRCQEKHLTIPNIGAVRPHVTEDNRRPDAPTMAVGQQVLGPVMVDWTRWQVQHLRSWLTDVGFALPVGESHHRIRVGHVEVLTDQCHAQQKIKWIFTHFHANF